MIKNYKEKMQKTSIIFLISLQIISQASCVRSNKILDIEAEPVLTQKILRLQNLKKERMEANKRHGVNKLNDINRDADPETICNPAFLAAFGITSTLHGLFAATSNEKRFCRRNELTCCTDENILSTKKHYDKAAEQLRYRVDMLEEVLTMFKGPIFHKAIFSIKKNTNRQCDYLFETPEKRIEFVSMNYLEEQSEIITSLLIDLEDYVKRQKWFYADFICTICNPMNHQYIQMTENKSSLQINVTTCSEILEIQDFETRIADLYLRFINPYINILKCIQLEEDGTHEENEKVIREAHPSISQEAIEEGIVLDKAGEGVELNEEQITNNKAKVTAQIDRLEKEREDEIQQKLLEEKHKQMIENIDADPIVESLALVNRCYIKKFSVEIRECNEFCHKNLSRFETRFNIFDKIAEALEVMFDSLAPVNVKDYYEKVKKAEFSAQNNDTPFSFYDFSKSDAKFNLDFEWDIKLDTGLTIFSDYMSKKFTEYGAATASAKVN